MLIIIIESNNGKWAQAHKYDQGIYVCVCAANICNCKSESKNIIA